MLIGLAIAAVFFRIASLADSAAVGYDTPGLQEASSTRQSVPYFDFFWTEEIVDHLSEHDVSTDDFERVVSHPSRLGISRSSGRPCCWGKTADGRTLFCVYEQLDETTIIPVTAYDVAE